MCHHASDVGRTMRDLLLCRESCRIAFPDMYMYGWMVRTREGRVSINTCIGGC